MFFCASSVTRLTSSTFFLMRSMTSVKRPPPQRGRMRASADDAFCATRFTIGSDQVSYSSCDTGRNSMRAASWLRNRLPVSLPWKRWRL